VGEDELTAEKFAEQIRQLKIEDIVLSTMSTLGQLAYAKLDAKDLGQARLAIDAIAALLQTLEGHVDTQLLRDFNQLLANVRLSFADAVSASGSEPQASADAAPTGSAPGDPSAVRDETEAEASEESAGGSEPQTRSDPEEDDGGS
jgi:hypothetical protein